MSRELVQRIFKLFLFATAIQIAAAAVTMEHIQASYEQLNEKLDELQRKLNLIDYCDFSESLQILERHHNEKMESLKILENQTTEVIQKMEGHQKKTIESLQILEHQEKETSESLKKFEERQKETTEALKNLERRENETSESLKQFEGRQNETVASLQILERDQKKSLHTLERHQNETTLSLQILGHQGKEATESLKKLEDHQKKTIESIQILEKKTSESLKTFEGRQKETTESLKKFESRQKETTEALKTLERQENETTTYLKKIDGRQKETTEALKQLEHQENETSESLKKFASQSLKKLEHQKNETSPNDHEENNKPASLETLKQHQIKTTELPASCVEVLGGNHRASGVYEIDLPESGVKPFQVYCLRDPKGGLPWTVVQRRVDGSTDFYLDWADYKIGFGNLSTNFFIGLEKLHQLTNQNWPQELWVKLTDDVSANAYYDRFVIGPEEEKYVLKIVGKYSGDAGDALSYHDGMKFTTRDADYDQLNYANSAIISQGAWWYKSGHTSNLNGVYGTTKWSEGIIWKGFRDYDVSMKYAHMAIRPAPYFFPNLIKNVEK